MAIVNIEEGPVDFDDEDALVGGDFDNGSSVFTDYMVKNHYERDLHRYMLPVTDPDQTYQPGVGTSTRSRDAAAFVQLARPTLLLVVEWTAMKINAEPQIPDPAAMAPDWVLLDVMPATTMIAVMADGVTPMYRMEGVYVYGHKRPNADVFKNVTFPLAPWLEDVFQRSVGADRVQGGIATPANRNANFPGGGNANFPQQ